MQYEIKKELLEYFKAIPNKTAQENRLCLYLQNDIEFFEVTGLSRDDVDEIGYDGANMTDAQMERLASKLGDSYVENGFWEDLECHLEYMEIQKIDSPDKEERDDE